MRRTILMGLGLAVSLAGVAAAQQGQEPARRPKAERGHEGMRRGGFDRQGRDARGLLFKDITLTEAQKTQLKQLAESERSKMDASRDQRKKQFDEARAARQRGDTTAARAIMERGRQEMVQAREQHLVAVRTILTAEQRVQFDKNVAELKQRGEKRGRKFGK